jgi:transcription antitermination protein NusB
MASRRRARECALQMLFQWDISKDSPEQVERCYWANRGPGFDIPVEPPPIAAAEKKSRRKSSTVSATAKRKRKLAEPVTPPIPLPPEEAALRAAANELFSGTVSKVREIDPLIREHSQHWRLERMPTVDRNIVRLGVYEMLFRDDAPPAVIINEALEIARKFSEEESVAFINGVLDQIRKESESARPA